MNEIKQNNETGNMQVTMIYMLIHGIFWCSYAIAWSYTAVYLKSCGYDNLVVGLVTGIGAVISVVLQPLLAELTRRYKKCNTKRTIIAVKLIAVVFTIGIMCKLPGKATIAVLFTTLTAIDASIPSMLSSMAMDYMNSGKYINYGLARGTGSIAYAVFSLFLGYAVGWWGEGSLMLLYITANAVTIGSIMAFPNPKNESESSKKLNAAQKAEKHKDKKQSIIVKYPFLAWFLMSSVLLFMGHNMINVFLLNIIQRAGGNSENLGIALAVSAVVELPVMAMFIRIAHKIKVNKLLVISAFFFTLKGTATIFTVSIGAVYAVQIMQFGAFALYTPASVYFINEALQEKDRGLGQALLGSFTLGLGGALGNVLGGIIVQFSGLNGMLISVAVLSLIGLSFMVYCMKIYGVSEIKQGEVSKEIN